MKEVENQSHLPREHTLSVLDAYSAMKQQVSKARPDTHRYCVDRFGAFIVDGFGLSYADLEALYERHPERPVSNHIAELIAPDGEYDLLVAKEQEAGGLLRKPSVVVTGKLLDLMAILDPELVDPDAAMGIVYNALEDLSHELNGQQMTSEGFNPHKRLGYIIGSSFVDGIESEDRQYSQEDAYTFAELYRDKVDSIGDEDAIAMFDSGYVLGTVGVSEDSTLIESD